MQLAEIDKKANPVLDENERQEMFTRGVAVMLVDTMSSISFVERKSVRECFQIANENLKVPSRPAVVKKIGNLFNENREDLKQSLSKVNNIMMTADLWSSWRRSFLGTTIHWIDPRDLSRKSDVLSCCRMVGSHTGEIIAETVMKTLDSYGIRKKVEYCMTDGAKNMIKAFR